MDERQPRPGLAPLLHAIRQLDSFEALTESIGEGGAQPNLGLPRAARLPVLVALHAALEVPILLVTDRTDRALTLFDELALWAPDAPRLYFPEPTPLFYENAPWGERTRRDRLQVLTALAVRHLPTHPESTPPIVVSPARALMTRTLTRREFLSASRTLRPGAVVQPETLLRTWVSLGYDAVGTVVGPGQFARRGGIIDIWPPAETQPYRLDFFGDEVESLHTFDPATQRTDSTENGASSRLLVTPAREFVLGEQETYEEDEAPHEFHIPLLSTSPSSVIDYLPEDAVVIIEDEDAFRDGIAQLESQALELRRDSRDQGELPEEFPLPYITWNQITDALTMHTRVVFGPAGAVDGAPLARAFTPNPRFGGRIKTVLEHVSRNYHRGELSVLVSRQAGRLRQLWDETVLPLNELPLPRFVPGSLSEGWTLEQPAGVPDLHLLTDGEIFGWRRPQPRRKHRPTVEAPEADYADMQVGAWVVHVDHGIGRYLGLVQREIEGQEREYLCVEYAQGDQLFVPVHQADRLTPYVGPDGRAPSPTRLGGVEWRNVKSRVREAVEEVAEDLLKLYAQRESVSGHAFSPDTAWQKELEGSFPYIETEDQQQVIQEVKRDMERPRPMDRLICGDVGYGKTEVALRAAFKAVMDGKQVAILVPTTVLAQQHFHTFQERLSPFPVEVEMLSRFRSPQEQQDILFRLAKGTVDIVIGTHRLLQADVAFSDLGLLIIDEEQRFGVTHKEHLKRMRTEVDVLTMTATPIPRTLYMALTGARDISMISTPPEERLPVITHVGPFSKRLVRQAIMRELDRGGQVFFVHNRVQTIQAIRARLARIVPEARLEVAHGQLPENALATRMEAFTRGEIDVLVTTSIIESGLDIPNANTLIVDRADTFGLAQLYQLRGRVGRGAQRAYAYFFRHRRRQPTPEGRQRLETIAENTQLGAGFSIAMRDLEIRGAGDILGTRQHGHIAAVGFHLYTRLLATAVKRLRGEQEIPEEIDSLSSAVHRPLVSVDLPLAATIPRDYVPEQSMRLRLYRRIADLRTLEEVDALAAEFTDRFGPPPPTVMNLFYQLKVKLMAETAGLASVSPANGQIVLRYPPPPEGAGPRSFPALGPDVRAGKNTLWFNRRAGEAPWTDRLMEILQGLAAQETGSAAGED